MKGVYETTTKNGQKSYRASFTFKNKHISLGSFSDKEVAGKVYKEALKVSKYKKYTLEYYNDSFLIPFEKYVSIVNFRDNGIYFANPIYLKQKYFEYHYDTARVLKFDMDDLFYFSSHKIMCRGNRFFVADYGMQIGIHSRFGFKNYTVKGKDVTFINGDNLDFRRVNLKINNTYNGVTNEENKNGQSFFTVRIHVNGNIIVGRYLDAISAAIAYNKAVDFVKKHGINRKYPINYLEDFPASEYAKIYNEIELSENLINYFSE